MNLSQQQRRFAAAAHRSSGGSSCAKFAPPLLLQASQPPRAIKMGSEGQSITLVSFDVDGTLIHSVGEEANRLHKEAFSEAFKQVFGIDTTIDCISHHGGTDPLIAVKVMMHHGIGKAEALARLPEIKAQMVDYFTAHAPQRAGLGLQLLPGVPALLEALRALPHARTCLVTGNLEAIAWGKMGALGVAPLFSSPPFGGFGSDACGGDVDSMWRDRAEFVRLAARRCAAALPPGAPPLGARWHVGDTPADVRAALAAGAGALAVATGACSVDELRAAGEAAAAEFVAAAGGGGGDGGGDGSGGAPAKAAAAPPVVVLPSLEDTDAVLAALGLV